MQLRDHPRISFDGRLSWPPIWIRLGATSRAPRVIRGEVGLLKTIRHYPDRPGRIYLTVEYRGKSYIGCLFLNDEIFWRQMIRLLKAAYGMSLRDIGGLEIPGANQPAPMA